ncbi:MAG TPA: tetratricopeptide repeat protein [Chloroflexota bacterium]|nr:tetratricopeptide repeat protein [Chloroflexota bacterium]
MRAQVPPGIDARPVLPVDGAAPVASAALLAALAAHEAGRLDEAAARYAELLDGQPDHPLALLSLALLHLDAGRPDAARPLVRRAAQRPATTLDLSRTLAELLLRLGEVEEALAHYDQALQLSPTDLEAHLGSAAAALRLRRPELALRHAGAALRLAPDSPRAHHALAHALSASRRFDEAIEHYRAALALGAYPEAENDLGTALQATEQLDAALAHYDSALAQRPTYLDAHVNRAGALKALRRLDEARVEAELAVALAPDSAAAHNNLGAILQELGNEDAAVVQYQAALALRPGDAEALNNLGSVYFALHRYEEARDCCRAAVALSPDLLPAYDNLGSALLALGQPAEAREQYETALRLEPANRRLHQSLAILELLEGRSAEAETHGRAGFGSGLEQRARPGTSACTPILVVTSALGGNVKLDRWLSDTHFRCWTATAEFCAPDLDLPEHRLAFNAVGDADRCGVALARAARLLDRSPAPTLNLPRQVARTGRLEHAARLGQLEGVLAPRIIEVPRATLLTPRGRDVLAAAGLGWPLLLRAPGFHTGEQFLKVERPEGLAAAGATLPGSRVLAIQYLDLRDSQGWVRKYRVMAIDGQLYPLHLALARQWMVHYLHADMTEPQHQREEAKFLNDMEGALGHQALAALARIRDEMKLDYGGIDFTLDEQGQVVLFEANATMMVPTPGVDDLAAYRLPAIERVHAAVRGMIDRHLELAA